MTIFSSDNVTGACPEVMDAIIAANDGIVESYGNDKWSKDLNRKFSELFETKVKVWFENIYIITNYCFFYDNIATNDTILSYLNIAFNN